MVSERRVPFFNYPHVYLPDRQRYLDIFDRICSRGAFIQQDELVEFETALATFAGSRFAIGVANGTDAMVIALRAAGIEAGDEVIICSHTFVATAAAVHHVGAIPVPVECGPDRMIDSQSVEQAIGPRTRAIMPTQLNGRTADMASISALAEAHGLLILEDAAQALGSTFRGVGAGNFGVAGTISFYPAKSLGCFGDGGAILCNDQETFETCTMLRDHGRSPTSGMVEAFGYNSRLDNLQAGILNAKLETFREEIDRRREIASLYDELLHGVSGMTLPPAPEADSDHFDTFQNYEVTSDRREELRQYLTDRGIGTILQWGGTPIHLFDGLGIKANLPYTERFFEQCFLMPMNTSLSDEDVRYVADTVVRFYDMA
jgi:dTDP-4-amino-4,6-dideoxygalactose transaminase